MKEVKVLNISEKSIGSVINTIIEKGELLKMFTTYDLDSKLKKDTDTKDLGAFIENKKLVYVIETTNLYMVLYKQDFNESKDHITLINHVLKQFGITNKILCFVLKGFRNIKIGTNTFKFY